MPERFVRLGVALIMSLTMLLAACGEELASTPAPSLSVPTELPNTGSLTSKPLQALNPTISDVSAFTPPVTSAASPTTGLATTSSVITPSPTQKTNTPGVTTRTTPLRITTPPVTTTKPPTTTATPLVGSLDFLVGSFALNTDSTKFSIQVRYEADVRVPNPQVAIKVKSSNATEVPLEKNLIDLKKGEAINLTWAQ